MARDEGLQILTKSPCTVFPMRQAQLAQSRLPVDHFFRLPIGPCFLFLHSPINLERT